MVFLPIGRLPRPGRQHRGRHGRCPAPSPGAGEERPSGGAVGSARAGHPAGRSSRNGDDDVNYLNVLALILVIVGGINWGLVGLFDFNLVSAIFGIDSWISNLIYILVGLAAIYCVVLLKPAMEHRPARP
jgi:uncharacterized membrane protein YuzA (DUF378 family)